MYGLDFLIILKTPPFWFFLPFLSCVGPIAWTHNQHSANIALNWMIHQMLMDTAENTSYKCLKIISMIRKSRLVFKATVLFKLTNFQQVWKKSYLHKACLLEIFQIQFPFLRALIVIWNVDLSLKNSHIVLFI